MTVLHLSMDMRYANGNYVWVCTFGYVHVPLINILYGIQYVRKRSAIDRFFFFFGSRSGRQSACQIKESLFWGCLADSMQHPGQERPKVALEGRAGTGDPGWQREVVAGAWTQQQQQQQQTAAENTDRALWKSWPSPLTQSAHVATGEECRPVDLALSVTIP